MNQSLHSIMESHSNAYTWFLPNDKAIESYIQRLGYDATTQEAVAAIENCLMNQYIETPLILVNDIPRNGITLTFGKDERKIKIRKEEIKKQQQGLKEVRYVIGGVDGDDRGGDSSTLIKINEVTLNGIVHVVDRMFCY